jgi:hypothetical protein
MESPTPSQVATIADLTNGGSGLAAPAGMLFGLKARPSRGASPGQSERWVRRPNQSLLNSAGEGKLSEGVVLRPARFLWRFRLYEKR